MGYTPQESWENTINTMATLSGLHTSLSLHHSMIQQVSIIVWVRWVGLRVAPFFYSVRVDHHPKGSPPFFPMVVDFHHPKIKLIHRYLVGGWTNPSKKYARQIGWSFPNFRGENSRNIWFTTNQDINFVGVRYLTCPPGKDHIIPVGEMEGTSTQKCL